MAEKKTYRKLESVEMKSADVRKEETEKLRQLIPNVFTEGKIDFEKFKEFFSEDIETESERYLFTWAGKSDAIKLLQTPTRATLKPAKKESVNFDETENIFIEGDNLEVLKLLYKSYFGKIKMIYIDPPYNTGKDFIYKDNYKDPLKSYLELTGQIDEEGNVLTTNPETSGRYHSAWLNMMYPRLFMARQLLREDGVIFVSIDDHEHANLRLILNEIFGEENLLSELVWNLGTGSEAGHFTRSHEYILVYAKNKQRCPYFPAIDKKPITHGALKKISKVNPATEITFPAGIEYDGDNAIFTGTLGDSEKEIIISEKMIFENGKLKEPVTLKAGWAMRNQILSWLDGKETFDSKGQKVTKFFFNKQGILWYEKERETRHPKSVLINVAKTKDSSKDIIDVFGKKIMDFPKPKKLIKYLVDLNTGENDIVLDFFAGSGTTAEAIFDMNSEDNKNRKFILIQIPERVDDSKESGKNSIELGMETVADICKERISRCINKMRSQQKIIDDNTLDLGFKVFKLSESNYRSWSGVEERTPEGYSKQMALFNDPLVDGWKPIDVIYEVALKEGYSLNIRWEKIKAGNVTVYKVIDGEDYFYMTLDDVVTLEDIKELNLEKEDLFICRDIAITDTVAANLALQCRLKTI